MPDRRQLHLAAYSAAMGAAFLILLAAYVAARRERELQAMAADCEIDIKQLRELKRGVEVERDKALAEAQASALPADALVVVTEKGYVCPNGLDHRAGELAGVPPDASMLRHCDACDRYMAAYDKS